MDFKMKKCKKMRGKKHLYTFQISFGNISITPKEKLLMVSFSNIS